MAHRKRLALALVVLTLAACPPSVTPSIPPPGPATAPEPAPSAPSFCEPTGAAFDDHRWIPVGAPAAATVQLDHPDLDAALAQLSTFTRTPGHGLPIPLAFSMGQWSWQIATVRATLGQAGFAPAELVFVGGQEADHAWFWRSACDLDEAIARIEAAWAVRSKRVIEGMVLTPQPTTEPDALRFPYDVLMLSGERFALVPAGRASTLLRRWSRPATPVGAGGAQPSIGARLDELEPAVIEIVVSGHALVDPSAEAMPEPTRTLRVTAEGVVDGSLGNPS